MARQGGDAYPDPNRVYLGRCKTKMLVSAILFVICFCSFFTVVSAPGDQLPDPSCAPGPIIVGHLDGNSPEENPILENLATVVIE